jgi:Zn-dependent protease with chaperone function
MQFLLLLVLAFACLVPTWPKPFWAPPDRDGEPSQWTAAILSALAIGAVIIFARAIALWVRRSLRLDPARRELVLQRYATFRFYHLCALIGTFIGVLYLCGWGYLVMKQVCKVGQGEGWVLPGAELLLLLPFVGGLLLSWASFYDAEQAIHNSAVPLFTRPFWTRWRYVIFHARQNLALLAAPVLMLVFVKGLGRLLPEAEANQWFPIGSLAVLLAVFACLPWILRLVLGLQPLPAGPLRERLTAAARRLRFRCSDILLWNTHSGVANAMVVGVLPVPRYVVLSDRLISGLTDDELEAVFGHEVGHVKHYHMFYYLGFLFTSLVVLLMAAQLLADFAEVQWPLLKPLLRENHWTLIPFLSSLVLYIFVVFGFLSRRCERQADIFGCRAVSCSQADCPGHPTEASLQPEGRGLCATGIRTFIQALEKVAHLNGISRSKPGWLQSWQHSTIAGRVEFLQRMLADPGLEPRFQRRVWQVKWALLLVLGALLAALLAIPDPGNETRDPDATYLLRDREDSRLEYLYVVRGNEITAQVAAFPGYSSRQWYRLVEVPEEVEEMATMPSDQPPPFLPHGPWFSRLALVPAKNGGDEPAYFKDSNTDLRKLFLRLREKVVREGNRIDKLPPWIEEDERIKKQLGLTSPDFVRPSCTSPAAP